MNHNLRRVVVVGTSGSGKTTFARRLADNLAVPHIELDQLHWGPNWRPKDLTEFRQLTAQAVSREYWVIDGNYHVIRDIVWPRAAAIIWLNYPFVTVFWRSLRRTIGRVCGRQELFGGNRESFRQAFLSRESILWWVITTYPRRRREFAALRRENAFPNLAWLEFNSPRQADEFLSSLAYTP